VAKAKRVVMCGVWEKEKKEGGLPEMVGVKQTRKQEKPRNHACRTDRRRTPPRKRHERTAENTAKPKKKTKWGRWIPIETSQQEVLHQGA